MSHYRIPEIDVVIATCQWLKQRKALPLLCSVPVGKGIDAQADRHRLIEALNAERITQEFLTFQPWGPDIIAISNTHIWLIECKGAGSGTPQTQRNNFDRAVASAVSYYTDTVSAVHPNAILALGLALPATRHYERFIRRRVPLALRKRLNMWVLLYDTRTRQIEAIEPDQSFP